MPTGQVRCTLKAASGNEADDCINTFSISGESTVDPEDTASRFDAFYNELATAQVSTISSRINETIRRTNGLLIELIDTPETPPNPPGFAQFYDLNTAAGSSLPNEVAVCLSMHTEDYMTSPNPGRQRGRVYLGPLTNITVAVDSADVARVDGDWMADISLAAARLAFELEQDGAPLCVWSRVDDTFEPVVGGWVDNEFDTQRRRGRERSARILWTVG